MLDQHLFLNIIPNNLRLKPNKQTGHEDWCIDGPRPSWLWPSSNISFFRTPKKYRKCEGYVACLVRRNASKLDALVQQILQEGGKAHGFSNWSKKLKDFLMLVSHFLGFRVYFFYIFFLLPDLGGCGLLWVLFCVGQRKSDDLDILGVWRIVRVSWNNKVLPYLTTL